MEWFILFIVSWILFFILADYRELKVNMWCGISAIVMQLSIDTHAFNHGYYNIPSPIVGIWGSSLFFVIGPVFTIATLLAQYYPKRRWVRIVGIFIYSALYSLQELLLLYSGALVYVDWYFVDSIVINTIVMTFFSWFSIVVLNKKGDIKL